VEWQLEIHRVDLARGCELRATAEVCGQESAAVRLPATGPSRWRKTGNDRLNNEWDNEWDNDSAQENSAPAGKAGNSATAMPL